MTRTDFARHREPLTVIFSARTDTGRVRATNEDNYLIDRKLRLYVVCDGLGGHASGEVASATAVNVVRDSLVRRRAILEAFEYDTGAVDESTLLQLLREVVAQANAAIHDRARHVPAQRGMGTTLSLLLIARDKVFTAHVGDSRIYRLRAGALWQMSEDHSLLNEMRRGLSMSPTLLAQLDGRTRNQITRAVGVHESVDVDVEVSDALPGDRYLLASDGLHGLLSEAAIAGVIVENDISLVADRLVDAANAAGGKDNITAIAIALEEAPLSKAPNRIWPEFDALRATPLFRTLSDDDLTLFLEVSQALTLEGGDLLVTEDRTGPVPGLFIVTEGEVVITRQGEVMAHLRPGDTFGEESLFIERTSTVSLVAADAGASVLLIERPHFEALALARPNNALAFALAVSRSLARKVDASAREAGSRVVYRPAGHPTRPVPRPASNPRLLVDTEPEPSHLQRGRALRATQPVEPYDPNRPYDPKRPYEPNQPYVPNRVSVPGQANQAAHQAQASASSPSTVLRRPRTSDRRVYPAQTQPAPAVSEPREYTLAALAGAPITRSIRGPRSAELHRHLAFGSEPPANEPPPLPSEVARAASRTEEPDA